jgi:histidinol phosphatase-like PHP family hydrolase
MFNPNIGSTLRALADRNWHVHTIYSPCALPEMTPERILAEVDRLGMRGIALVDHHHPGELRLAANLAGVMAAVARTQHRVEVLIGAELSAFGIGKFAESAAELQQVAFHLYSCNHYHLPGWELPVERSPAAFKEHSLDVLRALLPTGRAHCIAHPLLGIYLPTFLADVHAMTRLVSDDELAELFALARRHGVAWEVSTKHLISDLPFARRYLSVGFEAGAEFRLGTDAHALRELDPRPQVERLVQALEAGG